MRRTGFVLFALMALLAVTFAPAFAVTDGVKDGNGHPYVVLLLMEVNGEPAFRCSGTLLSATVLLTAGHCAGAPGVWCAVAPERKRYSIVRRDPGCRAATSRPPARPRS